MLADFFAQDDLARLTADAGELLDCPLMVIDDAFRVAAHYAPPGFTDPLFDRAVQQGAITYEAGAIISRSPALSAGAPDYVEVADSTRRRRFAPLISAGVRLGYLVCVDLGGHLEDIPAETFRTAETVLAKQMFVEASRQDKPFGTAEEILMHLLDGGIPSTAYFRLQHLSGGFPPHRLRPDRPGGISRPVSGKEPTEGRADLPVLCLPPVSLSG